MHRIAEYLLQSERELADAGTLRLLETRGPGKALVSPLYLSRALGAIVLGRITGRLAGVHVNCAERLSLVRKGLVAVTCKLVGVPTVFHVHAAQLPATYASLSRPSRALVRSIFSLPSCCIALGQRSADFLVQEMGVPASRVQIVINGVPEPVVPRAAARDGDTFQLLFVGNLSQRKGVADLLHAMTDPRIKNARLQLTLAGGGDVAGYRSLAMRLGVADRVHFLGWAEKPEVDRWLAAADALVLPSYDEGLPLAILEALAQGVPVICTPVGEIPQFLEHGKTALFASPGDTLAIASAVAELIASPGLAKQLGDAGRALYEERFSLQRFATAVFDVHQRWFACSPLDDAVE
jgi:glycosyltransferase involved in cell wall biosynthesis